MKPLSHSAPSLATLGLGTCVFISQFHDRYLSSPGFCLHGNVEAHPCIPTDPFQLLVQHLHFAGIFLWQSWTGLLEWSLLG